MNGSNAVENVYSPDGMWLWTGQEWVPAPPSSPPAAGPAASAAAKPVLIREQKSVGQQIGNGIGAFGLIAVVIIMVLVAIKMASS